MSELDILNRIVRMRKKLNITQADLAEHLGLSSRQYHRIENGETSIKLDTLLLALQILDPNYVQYIAKYFMNTMQTKIVKTDDLINTKYQMNLNK